MKKYTLTPNSIKRMSAAEIKKAYSDLRAIANKRSARLEKAGVDSSYSGVYFPTIKQLGDIESIKGALASVSRQLRDERSTVTGAREFNRKVLKTLHENGYDFVNEKNLKQFGEFMEWARARAGANDRIFKSDRAAELFEEFEKRKLSAEKMKRNFDRYVNSQTGRQRRKGFDFGDFEEKRRRFRK